MPRLTEREWNLVYSACHNLYEDLDITNGDIKERLPDVYKTNVKDMKTLDRIMAKIRGAKRK